MNWNVNINENLGGGKPHGDGRGSCPIADLHMIHFFYHSVIQLLYFIGFNILVFTSSKRKETTGKTKAQVGG
jgi:hypothetical protein